jgi:exonuclease SbcC
MIPRKLEVGGLHSYREPVEVDFAEAVEDGLFGIFGPTGSGKSTLLDAMTLALYDRVDRLGGNEKTPMMNVDADELTVTYTFELGGTTYQAHRRWVRSGEAAQQRDAELRDLDASETVASQAREVTDRVTELLGMDFEQFTRAVFLPQGKFARFLEDRPKKRLQLLEEIFGLDRYGDQLRQRAREHEDALQQRHDRLTGRLEAELADVDEDTVADLAERVEETAETIASLEKRKADLDEQVQQARQLLETLEDLEEAREQLAELEDRREAIEASRERLERAHAAQQPYRTLADLEEARERHEQAAERLAELEDQAQAREDTLEEAREERDAEAEALDERDRELDEARARLQALAADAGRLDELREQRDQARATLADIPEQDRQPPPKPADDEARLAELDEAIQAGQRAHDRVERLADDRREALADRGEARLELAAIDESRRELAERVDELESELAQAEDELAQARVDEQAAVLGAHLEDGEPCPVCGSPEHPDPIEDAEASIEDLEARVDELETELAEARQRRTRLTERRDQAERRREDACQRARRLADELVEARKQEAEHREQLVDELPDDWAPARRQVRDWRRGRQAQQARSTIEDVEDRLQRACERFALVRETVNLDAEEPTEAALDEAREALTRRREALEEHREALDEQVDEARQALDEVQDALGEARGQANELADRVDELDERLADELADSPFDDEDELAEAHEPEATRQALADEVERFEDELDDAEDEVDRLEEAAGETELDADEARELLDDHEEVQQRLAEAREHHGQLRERLGNERDRLETKRELAEELDELDEDLTRAQRLTRLLGGRRFIEYLARSRFDTVLAQASRRLAQISGGQYRLEGTPTEIRVVDHMAGGDERDLRTLSGGETFMVSLSLALALSDAIQHERGGGYPPIEFFFLDEGFGSLDGDRLDQVMRMLHDLVDQDVHVGLITHVEEARHYVPRSVVVDEATEERGSRVEVRA